MRIFFAAYAIILGTLGATILNWLVVNGFPPGLLIVHKISIVIPLVCCGIMVVVFIISIIHNRN